MEVKFKNSTNKITLQDAIWLYKRLEICTVINDGKDITFMAEEREPISRQAK